MADMVMPLVEGFKVGVRGGYVTVDGRSVAGFPDRNLKIKVPAETAYTIVDDSVATTEVDRRSTRPIQHYGSPRRPK